MRRCISLATLCLVLCLGLLPHPVQAGPVPLITGFTVTPYVGGTVKIEVVTKRPSYAVVSIVPLGDGPVLHDRRLVARYAHSWTFSGLKPGYHIAKVAAWHTNDFRGESAFQVFLVPGKK